MKKFKVGDVIDTQFGKVTIKGVGKKYGHTKYTVKNKKGDIWDVLDYRLI